jgi:uncharacterized protein
VQSRIGTAALCGAVRPGNRLVSAAILLCLFVLFAFALDFPALSGRAVDQAGVLTAASKSDIEAKTRALEEKSGIQLVVATVASLQGNDIETYANELFRFWKLGEAKKNNGVLLLVAPKERKVRIEVGYGLEGTLTDALSSVVIASAIIPRFKTGDFSGGIERGVDGIISVLSGDTADWQPKPSVRFDEHQSDLIVGTVFILICVIIFVLGVLFNARSGRYVRRGGQLLWVPARSPSDSSSRWGRGGDSSSGSSSDSGFSGGGGSSGGGGASGSW